MGTMFIFSFLIFLIVFAVNKYNNNNDNKQSKNYYNNINKISEININDKASDIEEYKKARYDYNEAKYKEDFDLIVSSLKKYIECAMKLNRIEVATWQYNNLAYYNIMEFCYRTDYGNRKDIIYKMKNGIEKDKYIEECKDIFLSEYMFIGDAHKYIIQADILNKSCEIINKDRTKYIKNNMNFIKEINRFLEIKK